MAKTSKPRNEPDTGHEVDADKLRTAIQDVVAEVPERPVAMDPETSPDDMAAETVGRDDADTLPKDVSDDAEAPDADGAEEATQAPEPDEPEQADSGPWVGSETASAQSAEPVVIRKGGFLPMLIGGLLAAGIGFGAAFYILPEVWPDLGDDDGFEAQVSERLDEQAQAIEALQEAEPDLGPIEARLDDLEGMQGGIDTLDGRVDDMAEAMSALETRVNDLEKRPVTESASPEAVEAYERELQAVQDAMAEQRAEIEELLAEAAEKEASAERSAEEVATRTAMTRILTALDTGTGFAEAAEELAAQDVDLPPELAGVADSGVDTMADLASAFPDAARAALAEARKDEDGGFAAFLKDQLGVRSLEPREGDDADAILSRAEAAVNEGRLTDAMAEIDTLPESARAAMSDWMDRAQARADAVAAAEALGADLDLNRG
ncbi:COG4223 family protein [Aquicoccus sp.]|uniref:COG4223 family protein n=1 Tax=Aquicoccus sp. TaxID=2055851 RepID=UPI003562031D